MLSVYAGIDVGAQSVKAALFDGERILGEMCVVTEEESQKAARGVYQALLSELGLTTTAIARILVTGWGADDITFADGRSSEQLCAVRGACFHNKNARTVIDMGAEGCRVMKVDPDGSLVDFTNNSRCASGTGSFVELGAIYLKTPIEKMGALSLAADGVADVSSTCAVFAESVIISNIHKGESRERIAAGIHKSAAIRVSELLGRIGAEEEVVMIGGAALNQGLIQAIEEMAEVKVHVPDQPRTAVAVGAAIQASLKKNRRSRKGAAVS